jgi:hypothetical protein
MRRLGKRWKPVDVTRKYSQLHVIKNMAGRLCMIMLADDLPMKVHEQDSIVGG